MSNSNNGLLRRGSRGPAVADVRARLLALSEAHLPDKTGLSGPGVEAEVFDEVLERAVRTFQQLEGLIVDGIVGTETFSAIDGARWALGDRILRYTPGHLQHGEDVSALQERLNTLGFGAGRVDGRSRLAVRFDAIDHHRQIDGRIEGQGRDHARRGQRITAEIRS